MKALSVKPIWAGLIEAGLKTVEVRSRNTRYRGPLVICTSRRPALASVPGGVTLCTVDLVDSRPMTPADEDLAGVACEPGRWAWVLANVRPVERVPVRGRLGFYDVPDRLIRPSRRTAGPRPARRVELRELYGDAERFRQMAFDVLQAKECGGSGSPAELCRE